MNARRLVAGLGAAGVLVLALAAAMPWSEWGLRALLVAGGTVLQAGRIEGSLASGAVLEDLRFTAGKLAVSSPRVSLRLRPAALLRGELEVTALHAAGLSVTMAGGGPPLRTVPAPPTLPFGLVVHSLRLEAVRVAAGGGGSPLAIDRVVATLHWPRGGGLALRGLSLERGALRLGATLDWDQALAGKLDWHYAADGTIPLAGSGGFRAAGAQGSFEQRLDAPLALRVDGTFSLAEAVPGWRARLATAGTQALDGALGVDGALTAVGRGAAADIEGGLTLSGPRVGRVALNLRAALEDGTRLRVERMAMAPDAGGELEFEGEVDLARAEAALRARWQDLRWPPSGPARIESPSGTANLAGSAEDYRLGADAVLRQRDGPGTRLRLAAHGNRRELHVDALEAEADAARARATGRVTWTPALAVDLRGDWRALDLALADGRRLRSADGRLELAGTPTAWRGELDTALRIDEFPPGRARVRARGSRERAAIEDLALDFGGGTLTGGGSVDWQAADGGDGPHWDLRLRGRRFDPSALLPDWPGRLDFTVSTAGDPRQWTLALDGLAGRLRGRTLAGEAALARRGDSLDVRRLALRAGTATLDAAGGLDGAARLDWRLDAPDLADLWPGARGRLVGHGSVVGALASPRFDGILEGTAVALDDLAVESLGADWRLAPDTADAQALRLDARGVTLGGRHVETLAIAVDGPAARQDITLEARAGERRLEAALRGRFAPGPRWNGTLERARIVDGATQWTLREAAGVAFDAARIAAHTQCWTGAGTWCVEGAREPAGAWRIALELDALRLEALPRLAPWQRGALSGTLALAGSAGQLEAVTAELRVPAGELPPAGADWPAIAHEGLALEVTTRAGRLVARGELALARPGDLDLSARAALDDGPWPLADWRRWPLTAEFSARTDRLAPWFDTVDEISGVEGDAHVALGAAGPLARPALSGTGALRLRHANLLPLGTTVEDFVLALRSADGRRLGLEGSLRTGTGEATLDGTLAFADDGPVLDLRVESRALQVVDLPEASALADAKLALSVAPGAAKLTGSVEIPRGHFALASGAPETAPSADVVVAGRTSPAGASPPITADVRIGFGDGVTVAADGFSGQLGGTLRVTEAPRQPTRASGELRIVDGRFSAYGQTLELRQARLLYSGQALDDPAIEARAERVVGNVTAGLRVQGRLRSPRTELYSSPTLPDSEILSRLLVGQPLSAAKASDASALIGAATSLGIARGNLLTQGLARSFGLDELEVSGRPDDQTLALSVGKYLSPRLYVGYGMGLLDRANTVRLRYLLGRGWNVEAETGNRTGADLLYSIER